MSVKKKPNQLLAGGAKDLQRTLGLVKQKRRSEKGNKRNTKSGQGREENNPRKRKAKEHKRRQ